MTREQTALLAAGQFEVHDYVDINYGGNLPNGHDADYQTYETPDYTIRELATMLTECINQRDDAVAATRRLQAALEAIATHANVYLGHGNYDTVPAHTAEAAMQVARAALAGTPEGPS